MVKHPNGPVNANQFFLAGGCALALLLVSVQPTFSATKPDGTLEIIDGKEQFMSTLAAMPYTTSGAGPILYVLECSAFPPTQAFERDWKGQLDAVEVRRLFVAVNPVTANEAGYMARTRNIDDFYAFMNHTKVAPTITSQDKAAVAAAQSMIQPFGKVLKPLMVKNGWQGNSPVPPQFMWETRGHVYVSGYTKGSFQHILTMLHSGSESPQASAPPAGPSGPESAPIVKESSATEGTGQLMSAEKNSPKPEGNAAETKSESASVASSAGPDVIGLRIGMTPDQARTIFKSSVLVSDELRKSYREQSMSLQYKLNAQQVTGSVPSGKYLASIKGGGWARDPLTFNELLVSFSPVPGHEKLVSVGRGVTFPRDQKPLYNVVMKALVEKYGPPTYSYGTKVFSWAYDRNGKLHNPESKEPNNTCRSGILNLGAESSQSTTMWSYMFNENYTFQKFNMTSEKVIATCGAVHVYIEIVYPNASIPADALVDGQRTIMVGYDAAIRGGKEANALINQASEAASTAAIKKGQQQKPEF